MFWEHQVLRSSKSPQKVHKVLKKSRKCTKGTQGPQTSGSQLILKMASNFSKGYQSPRSPHRSTKRIQGDFKVLKNLSTSSKSSVGNQVRKILNVLKSHCNPQRHQVLNSFTRSHQKFLKDSSTFWENQVLRSSKIPQRVQKVLKKSRKCTKGTQGPQTSGSQLILKMSSNSSKGHQSPRSPQRSTKGIQGDLNSSKRYQRPQNPVVVKSSSNGHQMVLTESSKVPKNSPQMFHKKSSKVPERFFNVLRASGPQVFQNSSKGPESPQKVKKMHKRYPRSSDLRFSTDPQNVLKFLKRSSKPSKSSEVHKRYSSRHQSPQEVINVVKILWSSKVPQMLIKWSSKSPQNFLKTVLKWSTRSHQKFQKGSSMFWEHQVLRSLKSPQKVHKVLKKSRKCTKGTQGPQTSGSQLILKMASNFSKGYQSPRSPHRSTKRIQGDFKVLKNLSTSSKSSVGNQVRKILNVLKSHCNPQRHQVLNSFTRSHQKFLKDSSTFWENQVLRSSKIPQRVQKVLKKSRKCTKGTQGPQTSGSQLILKMSSNSSKGHQSPRSPQRSTKGIPVDNVVIKVPQMFIINVKISSKSCESRQISSSNVLKKSCKWSSNLRFSVLKMSS